MRVANTGVQLAYQDPVKKPQILCDSAEVAHMVARQINYAKRIFDERLQTLNGDNIMNED